jgi:hypothetical protein
MQQHALLEDVKFHFDHWRTARTKRGKIPGHLWDKVKSIMAHYPLTVITNTFCDYFSLLLRRARKGGVNFQTDYGIGLAVI